jgi:hypothetical protein
MKRIAKRIDSFDDIVNMKAIMIKFSNMVLPEFPSIWTGGVGKDDKENKE